MSIVYNSTKTADTVNRAIDNSMGTTTTTQGAAAAGKIITEDLQPVVQCTGGYTNPFIVKTISGVPPVEFHAVEGNIKFWAISGNTAEGASVGDKTANLYDKTANDPDNGYVEGKYLNASGEEYTPAAGNASVTEYIPVSASTQYTQTDFYSGNSGTPSACFYTSEKVYISSSSMRNYATFTTPATAAYVRLSRTVTETESMLNAGATAADFEPYGYKILVECADITYNCYISDVLRKSSGETPVYDVMDSTGTVTRNVDTDGTPLETPTTETYTAPTITTIWGYNEFDVDTTVTPSNVIVQYYDN